MQSTTCLPSLSSSPSCSRSQIGLWKVGQFAIWRKSSGCDLAQPARLEVFRQRARLQSRSQRSLNLCQFHQIFSSISYQISKHGVVAMTRSFGHPKVVKKTGIKVAHHHHHHHHHGKSNHQEKWSGLRLDWYHDCIESFSWKSDDQIKSHNHLHQYFAQHIAICPWFADTGILDGIDKTRLQKQVSIHYDNDHLLTINSIQ